MVKNVSPGSMLNNLDAGLCLLDKNLKLLWANNIQAQWFGDKKKLCSSHCYEAFKGNSHICKGCHMREIFLFGKAENLQCPLSHTNDGREHNFQITAFPIKNKNDEVIRVLEVFRDTTGQKDDEFKLQHSSFRKAGDPYGSLCRANEKLSQEVHKLRQVNIKALRIKEIMKRKYRNVKNKIAAMRDELKNFIKINNKINSNSNVRTLSALVARLSSKIMRTDVSVLRFLDVRNNKLVDKGSYGPKKDIIYEPLEIGNSISGKAVISLKPAFFYHSKDGQDQIQKELEGGNFSCALAVPVLFRGSVWGALTTYSKDPGHRFSPEDISLFTTFASEIGIAINELKLLEDIRINYYNTIRALVLAMEARDPYTRGHADRVTMYSIQLARYLKMSEEQIELLRYAGEVHDIGKIAISDLILGKPDWLTASEMAVVEEHPARGAEMLEPLEFLEKVIPLVRHHHERYDGSGYPDGLKKDKIPVMAKIISCADAFDAMTSERPYRKKKLSIEEALLEMKKNSGSQFDPYLAEQFINMIQEIEASRNKTAQAHNYS